MLQILPIIIFFKRISQRLTQRERERADFSLAQESILKTTNKNQCASFRCLRRKYFQLELDNRLATIEIVHYLIYKSNKCGDKCHRNVILYIKCLA